MIPHKITLFPTAWLLLALLIAVTCSSPYEVAAQQCMREELARQSALRQEILALQQQEQFRQMIERQQVLQFQREEQMRQMVYLQQVFQAQREESARQAYARQLLRSCR